VTWRFRQGPDRVGGPAGLHHVAARGLDPARHPIGEFPGRQQMDGAVVDFLSRLRLARPRHPENFADDRAHALGVFPGRLGADGQLHQCRGNPLPNGGVRITGGQRFLLLGSAQALFSSPLLRPAFVGNFPEELRGFPSSLFGDSRFQAHFPAFFTNLDAHVVMGRLPFQFAVARGCLVRP